MGCFDWRFFATLLVFFLCFRSRPQLSCCLGLLKLTLVGFVVDRAGATEIGAAKILMWSARVATCLGLVGASQKAHPDHAQESSQFPSEAALISQDG